MDFAISRILVPVDFSPHSERALRYATALAGRHGASVYVLHVVEDPIAAGAWSPDVDIPNLRDIQKALVEEGERKLERYRTIGEGQRVPTVTAALMGMTAQTITEYAKNLGMDLIVMGTHGRSGLAHLFMGSVAEHVVRHAPCPVLTLREAAVGDHGESPHVAEPAVLGSALGHLGTSRE